MNKKEFTIGLGAGILIASTLSLAGYLQTLSKWGQEPLNEPEATVIAANAGEDVGKESETPQNTSIVPNKEENPEIGQVVVDSGVNEMPPPVTPDETAEATIPVAENPEENIEAKEPEEPAEADSVREETPEPPPMQQTQSQPASQPASQPTQETPAQQPAQQSEQQPPAQQPAPQSAQQPPAQQSAPQSAQQPPAQQPTPPPAQEQPARQPELPPAPVQQASTVTVNISGELSHDDIAAEMSSKGLVSDADEFVNYLNNIGLYIKYKPGTHEIDKGASYDEIIEEIMEQ